MYMPFSPCGIFICGSWYVHVGIITRFLNIELRKHIKVPSQAARDSGDQLALSHYKIPAQILLKRFTRAKCLEHIQRCHMWNSFRKSHLMNSMGICLLPAQPFWELGVNRDWKSHWRKKVIETRLATHLIKVKCLKSHKCDLVSGRW